MASVSNRSSEENKESVTLIWFDGSVSDQADRAKTMNILRGINDYALFYRDLDECTSYIKSVVKEKIFLIASGIWATALLPTIIDLKQLEAVFIFCAWREEHLYLMEKFPKISGIFTDQKDLEENIRQYLHIFNKQVETFSFYDQRQKVSMNLSERAAEFLW